MELAVEIPTGNLSAGNLIKAVYSQSFKNWRTLGRLFFWPSFFWCMGCGTILASAYYGYMAKSWGMQKTLIYLVPIAIIGAIVQILANCQVVLRTSAVARTILMHEPNLESALQEARELRRVIFILSSPVLVSELVSSSLIFAAQFSDWRCL